MIGSNWLHLPAQTVFGQWFDNIKEFWRTLDYNLFWGWVLISLGIICVFLLIFFTEFKRKERDSVKFTALISIAGAILIGIGLHMVLVARGLW